MKNIILWGDSIRIGYGATVADELQDVARVSWPAGNCEHSVRFLIDWRNWLDEARPDVLHLNCGLHDIKTIGASERQLVVPLEFYRRNLVLLLAQLRAQLPTTRLIFATTTPVIERATTAPERAFFRYNCDIEAANASARQVAAGYDVEINDLWAVVQKQGAERMISADGVHFDAENSRILGLAVAQEIRSALQATATL